VNEYKKIKRNYGDVIKWKFSKERCKDFSFLVY
jgi:hypothetical protein